MGIKHSYCDNVDRGEFKLQFNKKSIRELRIGFFMLNNFS